VTAFHLTSAVLACRDEHMAF